MEYKSSDSTIDFIQTWATWLASGDTISTSTWTVESGLTLDSDTNTTTTATAVLSGGTSGEVYKIENTITTAEGLTATRIWFLKVQDLLV